MEKHILFIPFFFGFLPRNTFSSKFGGVLEEETEAIEAETGKVEGN